MTMALLFFICSSCNLDMTVTDPLPVSYIESNPAVPDIIPPVGKSGPLTILCNCFDVVSGSSTSIKVASIISPRLWGGILVAIPTAIPLAPLTNIFGNFEGRTFGSWRVSS